MEQNQTPSITREKHLDHMVKVVPFIVGGYALQSYMILTLSPGPFSQNCLMFLGGFLALMIASFIYHDLKHTVQLKEDSFTVSFFGKTTTYSYEDIILVEVRDPGQTFSNLKITTPKGTVTFYFIDDAEKVQAYLYSRTTPVSKAA